MNAPPRRCEYAEAAAALPLSVRPSVRTKETFDFNEMLGGNFMFAHASPASGEALQWRDETVAERDRGGCGEGMRKVPPETLATSVKSRGLE